MTANQSSRLYNDMGLAVCESYLTQFVDPLIVKNKSTFDNSRSGIGTLLTRTRCQSTLISFDRLVIEE